MSDRLPDQIDPIVFAERRSILTGSIQLAQFQRLADLLATDLGEVDVDIQFARQGKRVVIFGTIKATLQLVCQSCLSAMPWQLDMPFKLGLVASEQEAERIEIDCEPYLFSGEKISLNELIEDEILLALPDYPKHDFDCVSARSSKDTGFDEGGLTQMNNPFSVLAKLKNTGE